ncbi:MAG: polyisoprenoid-binding protein YceI [Planctomycetota bacterium]|jgi:polyisoprenoid-binding protein YceI
MKLLKPLILTAIAMAAVPVLTASKAPLTPAFSSAEAGSYAIDASHSSVMFKIKHLDVSYAHGRFDTMEGNFVLSEEEGKSVLNTSVVAKSVNSNSEKRDNHLRSPDFLNVKQYPEIAFKSTGFAKTGETMYEVTGMLDFHGESKEVKVPMTLVGARDTGKKSGFRAGFEGSFSVNRRDFGMDTYPDAVLSNEITLTLAFEGIKE